PFLVGNATKPADKAKQYIKKKPLLSYYQDVLAEGLKLAQADADKGLLDDERTLRIRDTVAEIVDDLEARDDSIAPASVERPAGSLPLPVEEHAAPETP